MSPSNIDDVNPPRGMHNIVVEVMDYVRTHKIEPNPPTDFETYDEALHAIWPELYKASPEAALIVAISIYVDIAERWDFQVKTPEIRELKL